MPLSTLPAWIAAVVTAVALGPAWAAATLPVASEMLEASILSAGSNADLDLAAVVPWRLVMPTLAIVLASGGVGLVVRMLLDGVAWRPARIVPAAHRIDPLAGLARIVSPGTAGAILANSLALAAIVAAAGYALAPLVVDPQPAGQGLAAADPLPLLARGQRAIFWLAAAAALVAAVQWAAARWRFERRIRMTPQEFQDEARSLQADPKVKLMREQTRRRIAAAPSPAPDSRSDR